MTIGVRVVTQAIERDQAYDIRRRVFQEEQGVPAEEEFDADDAHATHVLATVDDTPVGTGRIVFRTDDAKIGRMAVLQEWRGRGVGRAVMEALTHTAVERRVRRLVLHAQIHAVSFYARFGFHIIGEEFEEAGIRHRRMGRELSA